MKTLLLLGKRKYLKRWKQKLEDCLVNEVCNSIERERQEKREKEEDEKSKKETEDKAIMQILAHQKEQIDTLAQGIKAAQEDKLYNENKFLADSLAQLEAKRVLDEKYHK